MRARLCLIGAGLLMLAGCGADSDENRPAVPAPPAAVDLPASAPGGACELLDYPVIEEITGARFDVSAASRLRDTRTCVVRAEEVARPDLALSVTDTSAAVADFKADVVPSGGSALSGLGKAAYRLTVAPAKGAGPAVEIGWLSGKGQLIILRYGFAPGQSKADADEFAPKLLALAKKIDAQAT